MTGDFPGVLESSWTVVRSKAACPSSTCPLSAVLSAGSCSCVDVHLFLAGTEKKLYFFLFQWEMVAHWNVKVLQANKYVCWWELINIIPVLEKEKGLSRKKSVIPLTACSWTQLREYVTNCHLLQEKRNIFICPCGISLQKSNLNR